MYAVATQPISSNVAPRLPAICGSATLTIVVSRTSMIAAVIRPNRISQRCLLISASAASLAAYEAADGAAACAVREGAVTAQLVSCLGETLSGRSTVRTARERARRPNRFLQNVSRRTAGLRHQISPTYGLSNDTQPAPAWCCVDSFTLTTDAPPAGLYLAGSESSCDTTRSC